MPQFGEQAAKQLPFQEIGQPLGPLWAKSVCRRRNSRAVACRTPSPPLATIASPPPATMASLATCPAA